MQSPCEYYLARYISDAFMPHSQNECPGTIGEMWGCDMQARCQIDYQEKESAVLRPVRDQVQHLR